MLELEKFISINSQLVWGVTYNVFIGCLTQTLIFISNINASNIEIKRYKPRVCIHTKILHSISLVYFF